MAFVKCGGWLWLFLNVAIFTAFLFFHPGKHMCVIGFSIPLQRNSRGSLPFSGLNPNVHGPEGHGGPPLQIPVFFTKK